MNQDNFVRDIIPPARKSVSEDVPQSGRASKREYPETKTQIQKAPPYAKKRKKTKGFFSKKAASYSRLKFIVVAVVLYAVGVMALEFFSRAEVNIILKSEPINVNNILSASSANSEILAEKAVFEETMELPAQTSEFKNFNERASGLIVIYNAYSSASQTLVTNTRFETPDGLIYRINKSITVPGAEIVDGSIIPSSIEAEVFAEEPGENYNIGLTDFTIPGFKGGAKYEKFYARSKTEMDGGFAGSSKVVSEKDIQTSRQVAEEELKKRLLEKMRLEIPEGFLVPVGAYVYEIVSADISPAMGSKAEKFQITLTGTLNAFFIKKEDLKKKILDRYKEDPDFDNIDIPDFESLKMEAYDANLDSLTLSLSVAGSADAVWNVDKRELAEELALAKGAVERMGAFSKYSYIKRAEITFRPSWWKIFPNTADKIIINTSY